VLALVCVKREFRPPKIPTQQARQVDNAFLPRKNISLQQTFQAHRRRSKFVIGLIESINKLNNFRETWHEHIALLNTKEFS